MPHVRVKTASAIALLVHDIRFAEALPLLAVGCLLHRYRTTVVELQALRLALRDSVKVSTRRRGRIFEISPSVPVIAILAKSCGTTKWI